jgi:hypothetical protein
VNAARGSKTPVSSRLSADRVLTDLARIAFADIRRLFDDTGHLRPVQEWPADAAAAVASVKIVRKRVGGGDVVRVTVRLWDKVRALELLARYHGLLKDSRQVDGGERVIVTLEPACVRQPSEATGSHSTDSSLLSSNDGQKSIQARVSDTAHAAPRMALLGR